MEDLKQTRFIAENFSCLQGLRMMPMGLALILREALRPWGLKDGSTGLGLLALSGVVLFWVIGLCYDRRFGRVRRRPGVLNGWPGVFLFLLLLLAASWIEMRLQPSFSLVTLLIGLFFVLISSGKRRYYYGVIGGLIALLSLVPLLGVASPDRIGIGGAVGKAVLGLALVIGGILDHVLLVRSLRPVPPAE